MIKNKSLLRKTIKMRQALKEFENISKLPNSEEFLKAFRKALNMKDIKVEVKDGE